MFDSPRVQGVSRMADNERALLVSFSRALSDDELRDLHEFLRNWRGEDHAGGPR